MKSKEEQYRDYEERMNEVAGEFINGVAECYIVRVTDIAFRNKMLAGDVAATTLMMFIRHFLIQVRDPDRADASCMVCEKKFSKGPPMPLELPSVPCAVAILVPFGVDLASGEVSSAFVAGACSDCFWKPTAVLQEAAIARAGGRIIDGGHA